MMLRAWLNRIAVDDGAKADQSRSEATELRETRKRIRMLDLEIEVLRRTARVCRSWLG
jgi:hypothetical protein